MEENGDPIPHTEYRREMNAYKWASEEPSKGFQFLTPVVDRKLVVYQARRQGGTKGAGPHAPQEVFALLSIQ